MYIRRAINLPVLFMKRFIYMLAMTSMLLACKKAETKPEVKNPYPDIVVGQAGGEGYVVENADVIKSQWEAKFKSRIDSLQIIKSESTGEVPVAFYMLLAKTSDGNQLATVVTEKNKQLFFEESGIVTLCKSHTGEDFNIKGISQEGHIRLYCADCVECEKTEYGL